jgi:hypothetical protein
MGTAPAASAIARTTGCRARQPGVEVIFLGVVLLLIGFLFGIPIIWTLGIIAVVLGAVLALFGFAGREFGGRRYWY